MKTIEDCLGETLTQIWVKLNTTYISLNNMVLADEIVFIFENSKAQVLPIQDTDEITLICSEYINTAKVEPFSEVKMLQEYIGKRLSITWNCHNTKGYFDIFIVSFYQLHPSLLILSEGGVLKLFSTKQIAG